MRDKKHEVVIRKFDLNIERILEGWEVRHAIREVIANALDEQALTDTPIVKITKDSKGVWHVRDFGRGLKYEHLTQNENKEKLRNANKVVGKFGVGLKDALATLHRRGIGVAIRSKHGDVTLEVQARILRCRHFTRGDFSPCRYGRGRYGFLLPRDRRCRHC